MSKDLKPRTLVRGFSGVQYSIVSDYSRGLFRWNSLAPCFLTISLVETPARHVRMASPRTLLVLFMLAFPIMSRC